MHPRFALFVLTFAPLLHAQTTHVVQGGGNALQLAISAAAPGDILDVLPGNYTAVSVSRGVRISLRAGATVQAQFLPNSTFRPAIVATGVPAAEALVVEGGAVQGFEAHNCAGAVVCRAGQNIAFASTRLEACTGPVYWQGMATGGGTMDVGTLEVVDCTQVSFTGCRLPTMVVTRSSVSFADSSIPVPYGFVAGLRLVSGNVTIAGGVIHHGRTASWPVIAPGIRIEQGNLVLTRGAVVTGTIFGFAQPQAPAIESLGGTVRLDPSVVLQGTVPVAGPATVVTAHVPSLFGLHAPGTSSCQLDVVAEPNSLVFTLANLPTTPMPSPFGELWLVPQSPILDVAALPATGQRTFAFTLGPVPPLLGLVAQSASLSSSGAIAVGAPVRFLWD